jgi:hypothetical protein
MSFSLREVIRGYSKAELETAMTAAGAVLLMLALFISTIVLRKSSSNRPKWFQELDDKRRKKTQSVDTKSREPSSSIASASDPHDVWAERQSRGITPASLHHRKGAGEAKPFGSSYYYAHNDPNRTGGYKDGLRMEDFTMNGPRLLSKGGQQSSSIHHEENAFESASTPAEGILDEPIPAVGDPKPSSTTRRILAVTKYFWYDSRDTKGVGTIRIDQLPGRTSTDPLIEWKDAGVTNVDGQFIPQGEGDNHNQTDLLVNITTDQDVDYRLHIPNLYGKVSKVATVIKSNKRLLIKLHKEKASIIWPHPHQKKI